MLVDKVDSGWLVNESESYWMLAGALIDKDRRMMIERGTKKDKPLQATFL